MVSITVWEATKTGVLAFRLARVAAIEARRFAASSTDSIAAGMARTAFSRTTRPSRMNRPSRPTRSRSRTA